MSNAIHVIFVVGLLALLIWFGYEFYKGFSAATGSLWDKLLAGGKGSATILWSRFLAVFSAGVALIGEIGTWLGAPGVADQIQTYVKPAYIPAFLLVVALINEIARRRTL